MRPRPTSEVKLTAFQLQSAFNSYLQGQEDSALRLAALQGRIDAERVLYAREDTYAPPLIAPLLLDRDHMTYLRHASERIIALLTTELGSFVPSERDLMDLLRAEQPLRPFLAEGLPNTITVGRCDFLWSPSGWQLVEVNISGAIGGLDIVDYNDLVMADTFVGPYLRERGLGIESPMAPLIDRALSACAAATQSERPVIAIADALGFDRVYKIGHQRLARLYETGGFEAIVCNEGDLSLKHGHIFVNDVHVDAIHRQFVLEDMTESADFALPVLRAAQAGNVVLISGFREEYLSVKGMLCILRAAADQGALSAEDAALIKSVVPETHLMHRPPQAFLSLGDGEAASRRHPEDWVIKPSLGSTGTAVTLGPGVTEHSFQNALSTALTSNQAWVCQRFVPSEPILLPLLKENTLTIQECQIHPCILVIDGAACGTWVRALEGRQPRVIALSNGALSGSVFGPDQ
jgi:hypothetical protein